MRLGSVDAGPLAGKVTELGGEALRVAEFLERFLTLGKSFLGEPFRLLDWQKQTLEDIYMPGPDGRRARRQYLLGLPRKNGKSQLGSALALAHLIADKHDAAPEVISAAGDREQARLVFEEAKRMVLSSPELSDVLTPFRNSIRCDLNGGVYKVVSSDAGLQQGLNPSFVVFDELHVFKNGDLLTALSQGSAMRNSPLLLAITTAGFDLDSPLGKMYSEGLKLDGRLESGVRKRGEETRRDFGMTWWGPTQEELKAEGFDYRDPAVWRRHNPSWSIMPNPEEEFSTAVRQLHESDFIRYRLNGWTSSEAAFLPAGSWDACAKPDRRLKPGESVVLGFDGAWRGDSTALVGVALEDLHVEVLGHWEAPADDPDWRTPAWEVERCVLDAWEHFRVVELAADPWRFEQTLQKLDEAGVPVVEFPTNSRARMVPATSGFYQAVMDQEISHDGHTAMARHLGNAVLKEGPQGAYITKEFKSSRRYIDLAVAMIIGIERARMWREEDGGVAVIDDSPLLTI